MIPPRGFEAEKYPLRHKLNFGAGLSLQTGTMNSVFFPLVKNYKTLTTGPAGVFVNPHHTNFEVDEGAICAGMSIISNLRMSLKFSYSKVAQDNASTIHVLWRPIFNSFPEKLDAADEKTTTTVASILQMTKDATEEDITAITTNNLDVTASSDRLHPVSTAYITEAFTHLNMTTDLIMEDIPWNEETFQTAIRYYTNKGALKTCVGKTRHFTLDNQHRIKNYFIRKFVPSQIRRIVPYSFFGILVHLPVVSDDDQYYHGTAQTASVTHVGVQCNVTYDEWNFLHNQDRAAAP